MLGEVFEQRGLLLQRPHCAPKTVFDLLLLSEGKALKRVGMARMAAESRRAFFSQANQRAMAIGTGEQGRITKSDDVRDVRICAHGETVLHFQVFARTRRCAWRVVDRQSHHALGDAACRQLEVNGAHGVKRSLRHRPDHRVLRILHDRGAATAFDGGKTGNAVIQRTGNNHAARARFHHNRCGPEQWIDRWTETILLSAATKT